MRRKPDHTVQEIRTSVMCVESRDDAVCNLVVELLVHEARGEGCPARAFHVHALSRELQICTVRGMVRHQLCSRQCHLRHRAMTRCRMARLLRAAVGPASPTELDSRVGPAWRDHWRSHAAPDEGQHVSANKGRPGRCLKQGCVWWGGKNGVMQAGFWAPTLRRPSNQEGRAASSQAITFVVVVKRKTR